MVTSLGLLALLTVGSARRTPEALATAPWQFAVAADSVTLTYICGNTFRVRNTNATTVVVRWDVYGTAESGTLTLPPKPAGASYAETYFTTTSKGTVRLFEASTLLQTKANGGKPPCAVGSDTTRPLMPAFGFPDDRQFTVADPGGQGIEYYRRLLGIVFDDSTSGTTVRRILQRFGANIVGASPSINEYIVQISDPGPSFGSVDSVRNAIWASPGVRYVLLVESNSGPEPISSRWPPDGEDSKREDRLGAMPRTHGGKPPRAVPGDTARPPLSPYGYSRDPAYQVQSPTNPEFAYYRNLLGVVFDDSTSGTGIRRILSRFGATIVGGGAAIDEYVIAIPDPGPSIDSLIAVSDAMRNAPGVHLTVLIESRSGKDIMD